MPHSHPRHPAGTRARVLLTSVFGPYAVDDQYGSRRINPMELYHNQVTRRQGVFSLRMFHRSFGLLLIQANLEAPCTLLDFPDLDRFVEEIRERDYDIIGISAIIPNVGKVKKMCELVRAHQPRATIVVGGHIASLPDLEHQVDADHIVRGEGIRWFRLYLGQKEDAPIKHPAVASAHTTRILGLTLPDKPGDTAAIMVPSVGCPMGCNFCSTSALFGGKGNFVNFYETGAELFAVMDRVAAELKTQSFFILDENFLLHRKRALELLELIESHRKSWSIYVFSSARVLRSYSMEQLVRLGVSWVWMGLEGENSQYRKLGGVDTRGLIKELQSHGIRVLGSSIIGLEHHTPETIDRVIAHAVSHDTDFHQFMLYTANPGTPLHRELQDRGALLPAAAISPADSHGQYRFNHVHPHIPAGAEEQMLLKAFEGDFQRNGPSLFRMIRTMLQGWQLYRTSADRCVRERYRREVQPLRTTYAGALWAMADKYKQDRHLAPAMRELLRELYKTFGWQTRLAAPVIGRYVKWAMGREEARLAAGLNMEPATFYEHNEIAARQTLRPATVPALAGEPVGVVEHRPLTA
jgi:hypothetical protein